MEKSAWNDQFDFFVKVLTENPQTIHSREKKICSECVCYRATVLTHMKSLQIGKYWDHIRSKPPHIPCNELLIVNLVTFFQVKFSHSFIHLRSKLINIQNKDSFMNTDLYIYHPSSSHLSIALHLVLNNPKMYQVRFLFIVLHIYAL